MVVVDSGYSAFDDSSRSLRFRRAHLSPPIFFCISVEALLLHLPLYKY